MRIPIQFTLLIPSVVLVLVPAAHAAESGGLDTARMVYAERLINSAIDRGDIPGGVLLVGRGDTTLYRKAFGSRAVLPERVPMTEDTIFDLASVSKVVGCATSVMLLLERGQINLTDRVAKYIPAFAANGKDQVTVEHLLLHRSGLIPDNSLRDYTGTPEQSLAAIYNLKLSYQPGTAFVYSDLGYIVLAELVRIIDGRPLDVFAREEIFLPLGMNDTWYNPPAALKPRCAPTEQRNGRWMIGEVHDPRAYALGGVAGHAGLFSTVDDLARWCRMILNLGTLDGKRVLSEMTVREMVRPRCLADGSNCRGYGFDTRSAYSSARGNLFEAGTTYGHTGFTGTMFWIDPHHNAYVIFLTNHVHPKDKGSSNIVDLRRRVITTVASAIIETPQERYEPAPVLAPAPPAQTGRSTERSSGRGVRPARSSARGQGAPADVLCGIDVLKRDGFKALAGRKVALITNHTGRDRDGNRTVELLLKAPNVKLVKLFSPEHGLYGTLDEKVGHGVDQKTGLKVYSLYGETRKPTPEMLEGVDTMVYDIQDVGARFYTYISTLGLCMEAAAKAGIRMVVLDRPNPITGLHPDGPISENKRRSFTAYRPMPVAHGMTIGELAGFYNAEDKIGCDLVVIKVEGWTRSMWWDETGLMWVNPSPNMRNLTQAALYPAVCLLESTNVSVGRGTDQPFELFGAPWIDGRKLAATLNAANLPGLRFIPIEFTPTSSKFKDQPCQGVYILVTDRDALEPVRSGLTFAWALKKLFGNVFEIDKMLTLLANAEVLDALKKTDNPETLPELWKAPLAEFMKIRAQYLLYP
ncbi:MAG TPA: DUF1343 domain-containing protein [Phycisphaerae bacterium]|jgi:uncharacterized protein YbbC (DUF1343 family)/CubicO group peptidase (beta-lactamase class C family)|nr:DUF1343 domain-containing protein [Phycisphaerae bacterium]HOB73926.1 DUF1343 domain-containing protein [Phycisphaerae bacterium]HOJ56276.1 DUF1343 domain-containing protein [Phycisphaerae bacterium]HOL28132.1 DUF1343 domain-containing protein [Phycisphaerae bacterium]HPP19757.1 DUF1343 domain-containing protein [Phycisphaerae bacterium]